jgi:hypothetical protein
MPVMDGVVLGMNLSDFLPHTKIVLWGEVNGSEDLDDLERQGYKFGLFPRPYEKEELLNRMLWWMIRSRDDDLVTGFYLEGMLNCALRLWPARGNKFSVIFFDIFEHWNQESAAISPRERRRLLGELARGVDAIRRAIDTPYRYGENNFALQVHNGSKDFTEETKDKLAKLIHETNWQEQTGCCVSLSAKFAVVSFPEDHRTIEELIAKAMETLAGDDTTS